MTFARSQFAEAMRDKPAFGLGLTNTRSAPQVEPLWNPGNLAMSIAGPPATGALRSRLPVEYASQFPSGEKNGSCASVLPETGIASRLPNSRT